MGQLLHTKILLIQDLNMKVWWEQELNSAKVS